MNPPTETELREWVVDTLQHDDGLTRDELFLAHERAERGADLFDRVLENVEHTRFQPAWFEVVQLDELDMASTCGCVIGQLNTAGKLRSDFPTGSEYNRGRQALSDLLPFTLDQLNAFAYGFEIFNPDRRGAKVSYPALNAAWRWAIARRRVA